MKPWFALTLPDEVDLNFTLMASTLTFAPNDVLVDFEFRVYVDGLFEAPELVTLLLEPVGGESAVEVLGSGLVTIMDSDSEIIISICCCCSCCCGCGCCC